MMSDEDDTVV